MENRRRISQIPRASLSTLQVCLCSSSSFTVGPTLDDVFSGERYEAILKAYGQSVKGDTEAKKQALRVFIGLPA